MTAVGVIVATRNRPRELQACLESLAQQTHPPEQTVVVDDAPGGDLTPAVVARFAARGQFQYVAGDRRGLAAAHNRGLEHVDTPLVAFTDDDVVAEAAWLEMLVQAFGCTEDVACVTGRIVPFELATYAQVLLEAYAGFDKGTSRVIFDLSSHRPDDPLYPFAAGRLGSGANMAFSRAALRELGGFDPALGAGTRARGGDDLSAFFEVIQRGHRLVYEPAAVVRHRHAGDLRALKRQVYGYGVGVSAYLTKCVLDRPSLLASAIPKMHKAIAHVVHPHSPKNARRPPDYPVELVRLEWLGMLVGPFAYVASRRQARSQT